jgi:hypothetical protein
LDLEPFFTTFFALATDGRQTLQLLPASSNLSIGETAEQTLVQQYEQVGIFCDQYHRLPGRIAITGLRLISLESYVILETSVQ